MLVSTLSPTNLITGAVILPLILCGSSAFLNGFRGLLLPLNCAIAVSS
jgi:hypothetical protein